MPAVKKTTKKRAAKKAAKKKATKKTAAKKAAKKVVASSIPTPDVDKGTRKRYAFDILGDDGEEVQQATRESLSSISASRKNKPTGFRSATEIKRSMIPFRHFAFQYLTGCYGIPEGALIEFLGSENIGKSTLQHWLFGGAMELGCPCGIAETENKPLLTDWVKRALHPLRAVSNKMAERIEVFEHIFELNQMEQVIKDWADVMRGRSYRSKGPAVPIETPLVFALDSFSKLMSPDEAAGRLDYGDYMSDAKKKKMKGINQGSNLVHSKWAQVWSRTLPNFLSQNNMVLMIVSHQNQKIDMSGTASFMSADTGALYNDTAIGGQAFKQNASLRFIMARSGMLKDGSQNKIGTKIRIRCAKNSYGPVNRIIEYNLQNDRFRDDDVTLQNSINFDEALCNILIDHKLLSVKVASKRYTCERLDVYNGTATDLSLAFHMNSEVMDEVGRALCIHGYDDVVGDILTNTIENPEVVADTAKAPEPPKAPPAPPEAPKPPAPPEAPKPPEAPEAPASDDKDTKSE